MKPYLTAEIEVIRFENTDIIVSSSNTNTPVHEWLDDDDTF